MSVLGGGSDSRYEQRRANLYELEAILAIYWILGQSRLQQEYDSKIKTKQKTPSPRTWPKAGESHLCKADHTHTREQKLTGQGRQTHIPILPPSSFPFQRQFSAPSTTSCPVLTASDNILQLFLLKSNWNTPKYWHIQIHVPCDLSLKFTTSILRIF